MIFETLENIDKSLTLAINGCHSELFDSIMLFVSKVAVWYWLYILVAVWFIWKFGWKAGLAAILAAALTCLLTDQITNLMKHSIQRFRPCEDPLLGGLIRAVEGHSSLYGFPSGHAGNTFGFACLSALILRHTPYSIFICLWAAVVSYSRIYLGKHFLGDVIVGCVIGILIGYIIYLIFTAASHKLKTKKLQKAGTGDVEQ